MTLITRCVQILFALICGAAGLVPSSSSAAAPPTISDPLQLADLRVGTANFRGAMYPGAALPFSMVKLSPDTTKPSTAGYNPAEPILGFSHTHIGGIGGKAFAGQIRVRPQTGPLSPAPAPAAKGGEAASPGFYTVELPEERVRVELTTLPRVGFHRYTFAGGAPSRVLIDLSATINNFASRKSGICTGSAAQFVSDQEIHGQTSILAGDANHPYTVYFVARFDQPTIARGIWTDTTTDSAARELVGNKEQPAGVFAEFAPGSTVGLRVAISYTSTAQALQYLSAADGLTFDQVRTRAEATWRDHFASIVVEGGTEAQQRQFYTAMYHTVLAPTDVTGDNAGWAADPSQAVYWDIYTLWDTFRTTNPLLTLIEPQRQQGIVGSLLAVYQKTGWLPDAWVYNRHGIGFQGGTHADNVIADAVVKNLGGFDRELAYQAMRKNATEFDPANHKIYPHRGRLAPYITHGYVPSIVYIDKNAEGKGNEWSAGTSRTLEYSYNDFSVSQVAAALGKAEDAAEFRRRSLNAYQLFHPERKLFWGKTAAGDWIPDYDEKVMKWGWGGTYYEGNSWHYRFSMPHDVQGLIDRLGGDSAFIATLDEYFDGNLHYSGNEPGFLTPWLHTYAGRPDKNVDRVHAILAKEFNLTPAGYPGDEDVGAMSAWYIFAAMGFYPNAGQDVYLLSSPLFTRITLRLGDSGKTFVISAPQASAENRYIQSATLNGKPWDQAWFRHSDIIDGAELVLQMGPTPSAWGQTVRPPSMTARK